MRLSSILMCDTAAGGRRLTPIIKWAGGKRGVLPHLKALIPARYDRYYEPFLGGAAVYVALTPGSAVLGDANAELIDLYRAVRDECDAVMAHLDAMQPRALDEAYFYEVRARLPAELSPAERAARFIFLNKTCYNGLYRVNRQGQFNVPFGRYAVAPRLYDRDNLAGVSRLLASAELMQGDFAATLATAAAGDFVYLDPPYVPLSRTANFTKYTSGSFTVEDQRRLAETVRELADRGCRLLLSNSDTPLVRELYAGLSIETVLAPRMINSDVAGRAKIGELAIRNYR